MARDHGNHDNSNAATLQAAVLEIRRLQTQMAVIEAERVQEKENAKRVSDRAGNESSRVKLV
jgi:hypothetical protein